MDPLPYQWDAFAPAATVLVLVLRDLAHKRLILRHAVGFAMERVDPPALS